MLTLEMDIDSLVKTLSYHGPRDVERATWSALGTVGYMVSREVKKQVYGGYGWPQKTTRFPRKKGMRWWARFIKYRRFGRKPGETAYTASSSVGIRAGEMGVVILPLKDDKVMSGTMQSYAAFGSHYQRMRERDSRFLFAVFSRFEQGRIIPITPKIRRHLAAYGLKIKKGTKFLQFGARPIFTPAWHRLRNWIPVHFNNKFFDNLNRYQSGLSVSEWRKLK